MWTATLVLIACCSLIHADFANDVLKEHNKFRALHDVEPLTLNATISKVAAAWAKEMSLKGVLQHNPQNTDPNYGENIYLTSGKPIHCVEVWYNEINFYDFDKPQFKLKTGHFTQVVWKDTTELGVGLAESKSKSYVVVNYYPPGNIMNGFRLNVKPKKN